MTSESHYPEVVAVANLKGGVGKTTLCVNLAYALSYFHGKRVLMVDLDPQANATQYLLSQQTYRRIYLQGDSLKRTVHELFKAHQDRGLGVTTPLKDPETYIQRVYHNGPAYLDLVASKLELGLLAFEGGQVQQNDQVRWLLESVGYDYDVVFIDCPPTVSRMLIAGFEAAQHVLVPTKPDFLSSIGMPLLERVMGPVYQNSLARRPPGMPKLTVLGIVLTMYNGHLNMTKESVQDIEREAGALNYPVFRTKISASTKFTWSSRTSLPIFRTEPSSKYAAELRQLADEFLNHLLKSRPQRANR